MSDNAVLTAEGVVREFTQGPSKVSVLKGVDMKIHPRERIAIMGSSGSGKSTLLHCLGGLDRPDSGDVTVAGENIYALGEGKRGRLRNRALGFIYQFHHLLPEFTAVENVAMPLWIRGANKLESLDAAEDILSKLGLAHRIEHKPSELSGGERQRTAIGRALITKPACVLADEPTGNLDSENAAQVAELMHDLSERFETALIIVTHDRKFAYGMDRVLRLDAGRLSDAADT